tara:strand:- start:2001 stop:2675 length:675 start_codon:yes stop_codon:yes gene_type:complete
MADMPEKSVEMAFTDPPYGVSYRGGHFHSGDVSIVREREALSGDDNTEIYSKSIPALMRILDGPFYIFCAGVCLRDVLNVLHTSKAEIHSIIVWNKTNAKYAAMNAQYKERKEMMVYGKPKGSVLRWCGPSTECTVWDGPRNPENNYHPTQKPIWLANRAIRNHQVSSVIDPFMGAGSTMIAAKENGIRGIGIEIDPRYCSVAQGRLAQGVMFQPSQTEDLVIV